MESSESNSATTVTVYWERSLDRGATWQKTTHPGLQSSENISEKQLLRVTINLE